jgi:hypothetical protein
MNGRVALPDSGELLRCFRGTPSVLRAPERLASPAEAFVLAVVAVEAHLDGAAAGEFKAYIDGMRAGDRLEDVLSTREASQVYASAVEAYSPKLLDAGTRSSWC